MGRGSSISVISAAALLLAHPLLLATDPNGDDGWKLLYAFSFVGEGWKVFKGMVRLRVVHVLNQADDTWTGERGDITAGLIKKECKSLDGRIFYLCGPPVM